jgi:nitroreductase/NAD-dependent dihydropyrimidine dehydrogenase PreA subunit
MTWEKDLKPIFRPDAVHMGRMKIDSEKCSGCGLCIENCLFRAWEMGHDNVPRFKDNWACFSCYNCMVACPVGAISIDEPYHVDAGFWKTYPHPLPAIYPLQPQDASGNTAEWNEVEKVIFTRRSVRNFTDKPVPEPLIRRVLEAGRASPSSGNCQPWKFIVVTNKALINEINEAARNILTGLYRMYADDGAVKTLASRYEASPNPATYDPRFIRGGVGTALVNRVISVLLGAPVVILIAADSRAIGGPQMQVGICGTNMVLAATSLGLGATWVGFVAVCNMAPSIMKKLGLQYPFSITSSVVLGYPRFKQKGIVPREFRPITWWREGADSPDIEETPAIPEINK